LLYCIPSVKKEQLLPPQTLIVLSWNSNDLTYRLPFVTFRIPSRLDISYPFRICSSRRDSTPSPYPWILFRSFLLQSISGQVVSILHFSISYRVYSVSSPVKSFCFLSPPFHLGATPFFSSPFLLRSSPHDTTHFVSISFTFPSSPFRLNSVLFFSNPFHVISCPVSTSLFVSLPSHFISNQCTSQRIPTAQLRLNSFLFVSIPSHFISNQCTSQRIPTAQLRLISCRINARPFRLISFLGIKSLLPTSA